MVSFSVPSAGSARLTVYDVLGQLVRTSNLTVASGGRQEQRFDGSGLASGLYFYRIEFSPRDGGSKSISQAMKMVLVK